MVLGAEGVQIGSAFAVSTESSAHHAFKQRILESQEGDTRLIMKKVIPVRLLKNEFFRKAESLEDSGASKEDLEKLLGRGRARLGMFEGNLEDGELEIGQVSALLGSIKPAEEIIRDIMEEFNQARTDWIIDG
jgi:enoyl-[acyl-carrier protein] reductase II